jgi:hypothetical protein
MSILLYNIGGRETQNIITQDTTLRLYYLKEGVLWKKKLID